MKKNILILLIAMVCSVTSLSLDKIEGKWKITMITGTVCYTYKEPILRNGGYVIKRNGNMVFLKKRFVSKIEEMKTKTVSQKKTAQNSNKKKGLGFNEVPSRKKHEIKKLAPKETSMKSKKPLVLTDETIKRKEGKKSEESSTSERILGTDLNSYVSDEYITNVKWGWTLEQVREVKARYITQSSAEAISTIEALNDNIKAVGVYSFIDNKLTDFSYAIIEENVHDYVIIDDYLKLKAYYTTLLGKKPDNVSVIKLKRMEDNDLAWGEALKNGSLDLRAEWNLRESTISIWPSIFYSGGMISVTFTSNKLKPLVEKKEKKRKKDFLDSAY